MSARSFKLRLLRPSIKVMVVIHRFVTSGSVERTNPFVEGIRTERDGLVIFGAAEVAVHRFPDHGSNTDAASHGGIAQVAVGLLRKAQIGDDVTGHGGITISRYRRCGKWRPDPQCGKWRPDPAVQFSTTLIGVAVAAGRSSAIRNRWPSAVTA